MPGLESQKKISIEHVAALALSNQINHLIGAATDILVAPAGATHLYLSVETDTYRIRLGNHKAKIFTTVFGTDVVTSAGHGFLLADRVDELSSVTTLPAPLAVSTPYWIIPIDANDFYFALSEADARAGTRIDLTDNGTGAHTLSPNDVAAAALPAADLADGTGSLELIADTPLILPAPARLSVQGFGGAPVLTYYWL